MIAKDFKGYIEGADITKIAVENLAYPSKNVIVTKGKVVTRGGLVSDGIAATENTPIHSEFVWKDGVGGERPMRVWGTNLQVKYKGKWYTIYSALDGDTIRVHFATWVDNNGAIIKKRLVFCDGSSALYQWNGAIAEVAHYATSMIGIVGSKTVPQLGFDAGNVTAQTVIVYSLDGNGNVDDQDEYTYTDDPTTNVITLSTTPNPEPAVGDIVIAKPVKFNNAISANFDIDAVYTYKNHVICADYESTNLYWSHIETYSLAAGWDFTMPTPETRTALSPLFMVLDGNFTAMISRKDILWISDADDWYKVVKTTEINAYEMWVDVEKFETGERKGALPMAVVKHKGDIIYVSQDKTVQRVTTVELLGTDEIRTLSDDVESLLQRLALEEDVRIYYFERAIYIISPTDSVVVILDMIEGYFQPPQIIPMSCMSVIGGIKYGHSNSDNHTFKLFSGRDDLGTTIEAIISFGYQSGKHEFRYKNHTMMGVSCRMTVDTKVKVDEFFEENGATAKTNFEIDGSKAKGFPIDDDVSWATHPYAERSWAGADMETTDLRRVMIFDKFPGDYFDFRPMFTITGKDQEFHLLAWFTDEGVSNRTIGGDLFTTK